MSEHFTRGTESTLKWCNTCNGLTKHTVSAGRAGRCTEHQAPEESKRQRATREKARARIPQSGAFPVRIFDRLFGLAEEINGGERCPTYLYRWTVSRWEKHFSVYLHHFVGDDWSRDLHDHPKRFISIGLWGWYLEETPKGLRRYTAPWVRTFPATHIHRISTPTKNCWTLVIVLKPVREWGFWHLGRFIPWRRYVEGEGGIADKMKACQ